MSDYREVMAAYNLYSPYPWKSWRSRWFRFMMWIKHRAFRKVDA